MRLTFSGFQPPLKIDDVAFEMRQGVGLLIKCLSMLPTHYKRCAKNCHESFRAETHPLWHFLFRQSNISAWWSKAKKKQDGKLLFKPKYHNRKSMIFTKKYIYSASLVVAKISHEDHHHSRNYFCFEELLYFHGVLFSISFFFLLTAKMAFCPPQKSLHDNYRNDGNDDKWKTIG